MPTKTRKKTYDFLHYKHGNYQRVLEAIRKQYISEGEPERLAVPYILMCATTLEARINDEFYIHAMRLWGDSYKSIADAYLSMTFRSKLNALVPFLTNNQYRINQGHIVYQRLASLISVRNLLAHPKPTMIKFEEDESAEPETWPFPYPKMSLEITESLSDLTMGATKTYTPIEYHDAIEKLEKWFLHRCPDHLSKVAMVVRSEGV
ncbi:MAG: hypothetical protein MUP30_11740 [Deltaproteobacteria bacterium]|nr:hypothetical protein [Deltaproteobacteria bacterium]